MKHVLKKGKAEGSVLFTVISVMLVMVVFLMSTMVLTSSANRRSYYSYFETQAEYAAKAAIDAVTNSAYTDSNFYTWVKTATSGAVDPDDLPTVSVSFPESNIQFSDGNSVVNCTIEQVTNKTMVWDDLTQAVHEQTAYKITATAAVGNGRNRSEATIVNYIYENYQVPDPDKLPSVDNNAQNTIYKWNKASDPANDNPEASLNSAVWSLGMTSTGNNMTYFGPQYSGMSLIPAGRLKYDGYGQALEKTNENYAVGNTLAIGNYTVTVSYGMHFIFEKFGESVQIYGNFDNRANDSNGLNQSVQFRSKLSQEEIKRVNAQWTNGIPYSQQPYVYIDGTIQNNNGSFLLGYDESGNRPDDGEYYNVNLFCGGIEGGSSANGDFSIAGDAYLYDPAVVSSITGSGKYTSLARFASNNVNKANTKWGEDYSVGGNLICNNKELNLNTNSKGMTIAGDLIFTNPAGELKITNNITVKGKVLCAGTLTDENRNKINCDTIVTRTYAKVNGTVLDINNAEENGVGDYIWKNEDGDQYFAYDNYLFDKYSDDAYYYLFADSEGNLVDADGYDKYKANGYALMPYSLRLDEIFDEYLRWDLASDDINKAAANAQNDKLVQESIAAGHSWTDGDGAYLMEVFDTEETWVVDTWREETTECYEYNIGRDDVLAKHPDGYDWEQGGDGEHWSWGKYMGTVQVPDTGHWANKVYVPYTKARSGQNFIKHFTPVATAATQKELIGSQYYIDNLTEFTKSGSIKFNTINNRQEGTHSDVSVVYHSTTRAGDDPYETYTLNDALVITDNTIIDLSGTDSTTTKIPVFVDPYANGFSDSNPLRIIVKGSAIDCQNFVINNTAIYGSDYKTFTTLKSMDLVAGRRSVYIFFDEGVSGGAHPLTIIMSGAYGQYQDGSMHVVSNPIYPDSSLGDNDPWATLAPSIKFSYELVPNVLIFGKAGENYRFSNGSFLNAEVIMPNSTLDYPNAELCRVKVSYQEEYYSAVYEKESLPCVGMGTVLCGGISTGTNVASIVYIGDAHRGGSSEIREAGADYTTKNSAKLGTDEGDFFNDDHLGAS